MAGSHEPAAREWGCTPLLSLATKSDTPFDPSEEPVDMEDKVSNAKEKTPSTQNCSASRPNMPAHIEVSRGEMVGGMGIEIQALHHL